MRGVARSYARLRLRWADGADATRVRVADSLLLVPLLLCAALLASGRAVGLTEFAALAAGFAGMAMIFCALSRLGLGAGLLGTLNFTVYGAGLAALGLWPGGNAALAGALCLMVAALPLEIWFTSRKPGAAFAGAVAAACILAGFAVRSGGAIADASLAALAVMLLYAASLVARSLAWAADRTRMVAMPQTAPDTVLAGGDLRFGLDAEGIVTAADAATAKRLGVKAGMLQGTPLLDRVHVGDRVAYLSLLADLRVGKASGRADLRLRSIEDGAPVFRAYRVEGAGSGAAIMLVGRSLEEEQRLKQEIAALEAQLEAERIGKGRLLAGVAHELRTPLSSILGFSDLLSHGIDGRLGEEKRHEYAGLIHRSGHYMLELVDAMLDNARLESGTYRIAPQGFAFREAAEMCAAVMLPQAGEKGVAFCQRVGRDIGEVVADRRAVQQILLNLAGNAVKFTQAGGCVNIDAARVMADGRAVLEISVSDTGIGIAPDDLARIGAPFMRADNSYTRAQEGSGLGLSVVRGLVELHQGSMNIRSCPGEGTVVTVRLPVAGPATGLGDLQQEEDEKQGPGANVVIDMRRRPGERRHDGQRKDEGSSEDRDEGPEEQTHAQERKTA